MLGTKAICTNSGNWAIDFFKKRSWLTWFSEIAANMIEILDDMEELLASDDHYLLSSWLKKAKSKGSNRDERILYEFNARSQLTLWGLNSTSEVFDYACKAWSGLIAE